MGARNGARNWATEIESAVLDILAEVLEESVEAVREQPVLAAHEWDSITSLLTLSQLESRFDISLDLRSYHAARTVGDLVDLIARAPATSTTTG